MPRNSSRYSASSALLVSRNRSRQASIDASLASSRPVPFLTVTADHQVSSGSASRESPSAKPRCTKLTGVIAAGVALASGWPEYGSTSPATRSPMRADDAVSSLQWIGTNIDAAPLALVDHRPSARNCHLTKRPAKAAVGNAEARGIVGMDFDERLGQWLARRGLMPERVMVCHWSRTRPVLRRSGNCAERSRAGAGRPARPCAPCHHGVKKPPRRRTAAPPSAPLAEPAIAPE